MPKSNTLRKPRRRGPGREYATVATQPPQCPRCGSTAMTRIPGTRVRVMDYAGEIKGVPYNRITFVRCKCDACDQAIAVKSYENVPK